MKAAVALLVVLGGWFDRPPPPSAETLLQAARAAFEAARYGECIDEADRLLELHPAAAEAQEAAWLAAEAAFLQDDYPAALEGYDAFLLGYPESARVAAVVERRHQIGTAYINGTHPRRFLWMSWSRAGEGLKVLERIVESYPYEDFSDDDQFHIATYHFEGGDYLEARFGYRHLLDTFPDSEWAGIAHQRLALCILTESQGIEYDQSPIEEAKRELAAYVSRYPGGNKVVEARAKLAEIAEVQAEQEYAIAHFYLREERPRAAAIYLRAIVAEHGATRWADRAREELPEVERLARERDEAVRDLPPLPGEGPVQAFPDDTYRSDY